MAKTDYQKMLGSYKYQGQIQLMFDVNEQQTFIQGQCVKVLTWKQTRKGVRYI